MLLHFLRYGAPYLGYMVDLQLFRAKCGRGRAICRLSKRNAALALLVQASVPAEPLEPKPSDNSDIVRLMGMMESRLGISGEARKAGQTRFGAQAIFHI